MSVVELSLTLVVLVVAIGGTLRSISSFVVLSDGCWERSLAFSAAQDLLERMQSETFSQVFARYNATPGDDPGGVAPGEHFDVPGLDPSVGDADGQVGRILFPVDPAAPALLLETLVDTDFGMPRDLDADGDDDDDVTQTYDLLPVRVEVQWRGRSGNRSIEVETVLRNR